MTKSLFFTLIFIFFSKNSYTQDKHKNYINLSNIYFDTSLALSSFKYVTFENNNEIVSKPVYIDTVSYLYIQENNFFKIAIGIRKKEDSIFITPDINGNLDLRDDSEIYIHSNSTFIKLNNVLIRQNEKTVKTSVFVKPLLEPRVNAKTNHEYYSVAFSILSPFKKGFFKIDNTNFEILITNSFGQKYNIANTVIFIKKPFGEPINRKRMLFFGDTVYLSQRKIVLENIDSSGGLLLIKQLSQNKTKYGIFEGDYALNFKATDILSDSIVDLMDIKEYTLIDFWGTWCTPCKELTTSIKKLYNNYNKSLKIISIAVDYNKKTVKDYLLENNILWPNIFESIEKNNISKKYLIRNYPCFILINKSGKIIFRDSGLDGFSKLTQKIKILVQ